MRSRRERGITTVEWVIIAMIIGVQGIGLWALFRSSVLSPTADRLGLCVESTLGIGSCPSGSAAASTGPAGSIPGAPTPPAPPSLGAADLVNQLSNPPPSLANAAHAPEPSPGRELAGAVLRWANSGAKFGSNFMPPLASAVVGIGTGMLEGRDAAARETIKAIPDLWDEALTPLVETPINKLAPMLGMSVDDARWVVRNAREMKAFLGPLRAIVAAGSMAADFVELYHNTMEVGRALRNYAFGG